MTLDEAIRHSRETADKLRKMTSITDGKPHEECLECAADHEQLADLLTELQERREAVKKLEETAEYYKDSLFGDGIRYALKVIGEPRKRDWEREEDNG